jgi:hypothetical protein
MTQFNARKFAGYAAIAAILNSIIFLIAKDATMVVNQGGSQEIALPSFYLIRTCNCSFCRFDNWEEISFLIKVIDDRTHFWRSNRCCPI